MSKDKINIKVKIQRLSDNRFYDGLSFGMALWGSKGKLFDINDIAVMRAIKRPDKFKIINQ
tara:strand:+ start:723 stop:905 length:183 start_codon:yes stop_codon:yes gene_type:complete